VTRGRRRVAEHAVFAKAGDLVGESELWTVGRQRTTTAVCRSRVRAWRVGARELEHLCLKFPQFCLRLARIFVQRGETNISAPPT
jgi:CRP-like cAMP-binding protein